MDKSCSRYVIPYSAKYCTTYFYSGFPTGNILSYDQNGDEIKECCPSSNPVYQDGLCYNNTEYKIYK